MGAGQEEAAERAVTSALSSGGWALLQNCHLCPAFVEKVPDMMTSLPVHKDARLLLTSDPSPTFPIATLHTSNKVRSQSSRPCVVWSRLFVSSTRSCAVLGSSGDLCCVIFQVFQVAV